MSHRAFTHGLHLCVLAVVALGFVGEIKTHQWHGAAWAFTCALWIVNAYLGDLRFSEPKSTGK